MIDVDNFVLCIGRHRINLKSFFIESLTYLVANDT